MKTLVFILFLNLLYFFFFFTREYNTNIKIATEVEVSTASTVWYVYKTKYSEERFFSKRTNVPKNTKNRISFLIETKEELDYLGLFWTAKKGSNIKISSFEYEINDRLYKETEPRNIIQYTNPGSVTSNKNDGVVIASTNSDRNWIIYSNPYVINEKRDSKNFSAIPWLFNIPITIIAFLLFHFRNPEEPFLELKGLRNVEDLKKALLCFWAFMMPFWIIISHTLLAIISAISLYQIVANKPLLKKNRKQYSLIISFSILYISILISSLVTGGLESIQENLLDYAYIAFVPLSFFKLSETTKLGITKFFKLGLLLYVILLLVFTLDKYFNQSQEYSFIRILELNLELFWHTSYFSFMILVVFMLNINNRLNLRSTEFIVLIASIILMYLLNARLAFLLGILLLSYRIIRSIQNKVFQIPIILASGLIVIGSMGYFLSKTDNSNLGDIRSFDARLSVWQSGIGQIGKNIWFGVGDDNTIAAISENLTDENRTKYRNYNAHNQFIEILLSFGIVVFCIFIFNLFLYLKSSTLQGKLFIFIVSVLFLVESYLQRQAGIVLFTFWLFFFYNYDGQTNKKLN